MVIIQTEQIFDFTIATIEEKKDLINKLFIKQKQLATLTINCLNPSSELFIYLMFIVALCKSDFSDFFYHHIPNQIVDSDDFASLFPAKRDEYMFNRSVEQTKS